MMKATKNVNKPIKTHFWDAMLLNECQLVRPHNFLALTNSKSILMSHIILMSIDFEFIRARKSNSCNLCAHIKKYVPSCSKPITMNGKY